MLFCQDIRRVSFATNVRNGDFIEFIHGLAHSVFANVVMAHALGTARIAPEDCRLIVIKYGGRNGGTQPNITHNIT